MDGKWMRKLSWLRSPRASRKARPLQRSRLTARIRRQRPMERRTGGTTYVEVDLTPAVYVVHKGRNGCDGDECRYRKTNSG